MVVSVPLILKQICIHYSRNKSHFTRGELTSIYEKHDDGDIGIDNDDNGADGCEDDDHSI